MITWVSIQSEVHFMQELVHKLDVDTRYRFIHKLDKNSAHIGAFLNIKCKP